MGSQTVRMSGNQNAEGYEIVKQLMSISGVWPNKNAGLFYNFRKVETCVISVALIATMWIEAFHEWNDFVKLSEVAYVLVTATGYNFKLFNFLFHRREFDRLLKCLNEPVLNRFSKTFDGWRKPIDFANLFNKVYLGGAGAVIIAYACIPLLDDSSLPLPFPYELGRFTPFFYIFQVVGLGTAAWNNSSLDSLVVGLTSIAIGHLNILEERLRGVGKHGKEEEVEREVADCVDHHHAIMK